MGKANKRKNRRLDGMMGDVVAEENEDAVMNKSSEVVANSVVQSIMDQLQSPKPEDRDCGANALATLPQDKKDVLLVLQSDIVRACAPLMLDKNAAIRHSAAGALRNLSTVGGEEACDIMVAQDVLTPLLTFVKKFPTTWSSPKKVVPHSAENLERIHSSEEQLVEAITLLWNLCESSPKAVEICNSESIVDTLKLFLDPLKFGKNVVLAIENCLYTLTESNPDSIEKLKTEDVAILRLMGLDVVDEEISEPSKTLIRILAAGIAYNLCSGKISVLPSNVQVLIGECLADSLKPDPLDSLHSISMLIGQIEPNREESTTEPSLEEKDLEERFQAFDDMVSAQNTALMLLANMCCSAEAEDWEDVSSEDESEASYEDDEMTATVKEEQNIIPMVILETLRSKSSSRSYIFEMVLNKTRASSENLSLPPGIYSRRFKSLLEKLKTVRSDAFLCLSNLVPILLVEELGGVDAIFSAWCNLNRMIFQSDEAAADLTLAEAAVNGIRSLTEKIRGISPKSFEQLTPEDVTTLCTGIFQCPEPSIRASVIRILCCIGVSLSGKPTETPSENSCAIIKIIGSCLIQVITTDAELWIVAEALDATYDVFAEDNINNIVAEIGLIGTLKSVVGPLKQRVIKEKKTLGEHLAIVTTAKLNLNRFIKYKISVK